MPGFLPDTSCMVPAVCAWHEHHRAAQSELSRRLGDDEPMLVAGPALVESYAVLTRLPRPHRLSARDAHRLIEASFVENGKVVALDGRAYRDLLTAMAAGGISGGRAYDTVIAECALRERGVTLLTFNVDDFAPFATRGLAIVMPGR
ncbi:MAG TPA: PIN domain-containing protein [Methylomirabilota bacterium]|nr:PIN domain-containing protein [Methylomirabilota bacterium]